VTRCYLFAVALNFALAVTTAWAQQPSKVPVVGVFNLVVGAEDAIMVALRQAFHELGYVEGRNIRIELRTAQRHVDRLPDLAQELVKLKVDVVVTGCAVLSGCAVLETSAAVT